MSCDLTSTSFHSNIGKKRYYCYFLYLMSLVGKKSITCDLRLLWKFRMTRHEIIYYKNHSEF